MPARSGGASEFEGAEPESLQWFRVDACEFVLYECGIEGQIVGREARGVQLFTQRGNDLGEGGRTAEILGMDAVDLGGAGIATGIDERRPPVTDGAVGIATDDGDLDDPVGDDIEPGRFHIEHGERKPRGTSSVFGEADAA